MYPRSCYRKETNKLKAQASTAVQIHMQQASLAVQIHMQQASPAVQIHMQQANPCGQSCFCNVYLVHCIYYIYLCYSHLKSIQTYM